jgi:hypothetical protein
MKTKENPRVFPLSSAMFYAREMLVPSIWPFSIFLPSIPLLSSLSVHSIFSLHFTPWKIVYIILTDPYIKFIAM